jgi:hypothetical protein
MFNYLTIEKDTICPHFCKLYFFLCMPCAVQHYPEIYIRLFVSLILSTYIPHWPSSLTVEQYRQLIWQLRCIFSVLRFTAYVYPFGIFKLVATVLSVHLWFTAYDYPFGIFKLVATVLSVHLLFTAYDYPFGIFKLVATVLSVHLRFTAYDYSGGPLVSSNTSCVITLFELKMKKNQNH